MPGLFENIKKGAFQLKKFIIIILFLMVFSACAFADEAWVLCVPGTYVNTRTTPSTKYEPNGILGSGWKVDAGKKSKGFIYLDIANEDGYGWISEKYIVYSEPVIKTFRTNIYSNGRVACRQGINGRRKCFVDEGEAITVYAVSKEWSVTEKGFIQTKYLGVSYDQLYKTRMEIGEKYTNPEDLSWEDD